MARRSNSQYPYLATHWDNVYQGNLEGNRFVADHVAAITWDDLRAPASTISIFGFGTDPDVDSNTGHLLFSPTITETVFIFFQMPHNLVKGVPVHPHVHWIKEGANTVVWQLEYKLYDLNGAYPANYTTLTTTSVTRDYGDVSPAINVHTLSSFDAISTDSISNVSAMIECKVSRLGGNGADNYSGDARLVEFDIHVPVIGHGSFLEYEGGYSLTDLGGG